MGGHVKDSVNPALIATFVHSTQNVLSTMVGMESTIEKPEIRDEHQTSFDVSGIVGFTGEVVGSVVVSFHEKTAINIVNAFTMEEYDVDSDDFADAIGELCNMIAGNAKKDFGLQANISIPNVVIGPNHKISRMRDVPCFVIPCRCPAGAFSVEVNIKQLKPVTV